MDIDWTDLRSAHAQCRSVLRRLAADSSLLTHLVDRLADDKDLLADADHHPVMDRLTLWHDPDRGIYLRLHVSPGTNELIPHDHKYSFTTYILRGSYTHVWRRREGSYQGDFTSDQAPLGLVTSERVGSCYTLGYSLIHQTVMEAGTVTLFMRGPKEQARSYAALDMLDRLTVDAATEPVASEQRRHTDGERGLGFDEYLRLRDRLSAQGVLEPSVSPTDITTTHPERRPS
ncbi:hypothetical protein EH183_30570 [Streptomyces sp. CB01881]|nr:hypothetical protein C2142_30505 [Streptomyces sp. CB01881]TYC70831.1 hypothetical protein EH183_30570 [Streptomyces sp. CB01881]